MFGMLGFVSCTGPIHVNFCAWSTVLAEVIHSEWNDKKKLKWQFLFFSVFPIYFIYFKRYMYWFHSYFLSFFFCKHISAIGTGRSWTTHDIPRYVRFFNKIEDWTFPTKLIWDTYAPWKGQFFPKYFVENPYFVIFSLFCILRWAVISGSLEFHISGAFGHSLGWIDIL